MIVRDKQGKWRNTEKIKKLLEDLEMSQKTEKGRDITGALFVSLIGLAVLLFIVWSLL